jgi:hypothetical protein
MKMRAHTDERSASAAAIRIDNRSASEPPTRTSEERKRA